MKARVFSHIYARAQPNGLLRLLDKRHKKKKCREAEEVEKEELCVCVWEGGSKARGLPPHSLLIRLFCACETTTTKTTTKLKQKQQL